jgi:predicted RNase H-like nuclease (RuvC/YqgF family)
LQSGNFGDDIRRLTEKDAELEKDLGDVVEQCDREKAEMQAELSFQSDENSSLRSELDIIKAQLEDSVEKARFEAWQRWISGARQTIRLFSSWRRKS